MLCAKKTKLVVTKDILKSYFGHEFCLFVQRIIFSGNQWPDVPRYRTTLGLVHGQVGAFVIHTRC